MTGTICKNMSNKANNHADTLRLQDEVRREAEVMLRELAFVLAMTAKVKQAMTLSK